jgi:hypothetical protein
MEPREKGIYSMSTYESNTYTIPSGTDLVVKLVKGFPGTNGDRIVFIPGSLEGFAWARALQLNPEPEQCTLYNKVEARLLCRVARKQGLVIYDVDVKEPSRP